MSYHNKIMNIAERYPDQMTDAGERHIYRVGHRDARHDAAAIAINADLVIEDLLQALWAILQWDIDNQIPGALFSQAKLAVDKAKATGMPIDPEDMARFKRDVLAALP